jgi:hypothetical protein
MLSPIFAAGALLLSLLSFLRGGSARLEGITERLTRAETKLDLLMKDLSLVAASSLHREDDRHGLDRLLEGYEARTLTRDQIRELQARLEALAEAGEPRERMLARVMLRNMHTRYIGD